MDDKGRGAGRPAGGHRICQVQLRPSVRPSVRPSRMLTGKSAIPIDAAMHKRSAENVSTMAAGAATAAAEEEDSLLKPVLAMIWSRHCE